MPKLLPSELPVVCRIRHPWIVLFPLPHKLTLAAYAVLVVIAIFAHSALAWLFFVVSVVVGVMLRYQAWQAEQVILTRKRIIRVQGIPETTSSEAWLRVDRVSGLRLVETVPGKLLHYATIELEAPGDHPGLRRLEHMRHGRRFYTHLRRIVFADGRGEPDPDEDLIDNPTEYVTEPLPPGLPPERPRFGRRSG